MKNTKPSLESVTKENTLVLNKREVLTQEGINFKPTRRLSNEYYLTLKIFKNVKTLWCWTDKQEVLTQV